jgi:hypothetical protein
MRIKQSWLCLTAITVTFLALESQAQKLSSRSDLRRVVDPSGRSAVGSVHLSMDISTGKETVDFFVTGLSQDSISLGFSPEPSFPFQEADITNFFVYSVAPVDRINVKKGSWARHLEAIGGSPAEIPFITDLSQATGTCMSIGRVDDPRFIMGVTNVVGNTTNVIFGIPVPLPNVTNTVNTSFWVPLYAPIANPAARSYSRKGTLAPPLNTPPSPGAKGTILIRFNGAQGHSQFDLRASNLVRGQTLHVFIADSTNQNTFVLVDAGTLTLKGNGSSARFLRDTRFGDPLPQQARDPGDLSGRVIQVLDENGNPPFIYLEGVIP